jgi:hypothetical protein
MFPAEQSRQPESHASTFQLARQLVPNRVLTAIAAIATDRAKILQSQVKTSLAAAFDQGGTATSG